MSQAAETQTAFDLVGGAPVVSQIVERFYDLMEQDPAFAELRQLHAPDLAPMRRSLTGFLTAWLGGPRDWFTDNPGKCMMSAHRDVSINQDTARQWVDAMSLAIKSVVPDANFADRMAEALGSMASSMARA
jgi:hemoglobin